MANNVPIINGVGNLPEGVSWKYRPTMRIAGQVFDKCESDLTFTVPMGVLTQFLTVVGGGVTGGVGSVQWVVPLQHPLFPFLIAKRIDGEAIGWDPTSTAQFNGATVNNSKGFYSHAVVTVHFETPPWALAGQDAFLTVQAKPSGRSLAIPASGGTLSDGTHTAHDPGVWVPGFTYDVTVHQLPYLNEGFWLSFAGATNSVTFRNCPPGTVLYHCPGFTRSSTFLGVTSYEVTHSFEVSALNWNNEFGMNGQFDAWSLTASSGPRYASVDLNQLFGY